MHLYYTSSASAIHPGNVVQVLFASAVGHVVQIAFLMGVIHVDEGVAHGGTPEECHRATEALSLLHQANAPDLPLHYVQLEDVFEAEEGNSAMAVDKRTLLINLLQVEYCRRMKMQL